MAKKMDVKTYIEQFNVLAVEIKDGDNNEDLTMLKRDSEPLGEDIINRENMSHILYSAILNRFKITLTEEEYDYFKEYQERVFDLVDNFF